MAIHQHLPLISSFTLFSITSLNLSHYVYKTRSLELIIFNVSSSSLILTFLSCINSKCSFIFQNKKWDSHHTYQYRNYFKCQINRSVVQRDNCTYSFGRRNSILGDPIIEIPANNIFSLSHFYYKTINLVFQYCH